VLIYKKTARNAAVILALFAAAGCSQETTGSPNPDGNTTPPPLSSSGQADSQVKAPSVATPLNVSKFAQDPCLSLTQTQVQGFQGSTPGSRADSDKGVGCFWNLGANGSASTTVSFIPKVTNGLTNTYQQNAAKFFEHGYFEPVEVEGYPAAYNEVVDQRSSGQCSLTVGVSDQSIFTVFIQGRAGTDGCKAALNVGKEVLHTIQGGQ
jgi:hypothetical protein